MSYSRKQEFFVIPKFLTPKKDGICRICIVSQAINMVIVFYRFLILRQDDLLD